LRAQIRLWRGRDQSWALASSVQCSPSRRFVRLFPIERQFKSFFDESLTNLSNRVRRKVE